MLPYQVASNSTNSLKFKALSRIRKMSIFGSPCFGSNDVVLFHLCLQQFDTMPDDGYI